MKLIVHVDLPDPQLPTISVKLVLLKNDFVNSVSSNLL